MKLELKHLAPYLPFKLKCKTSLGILELSRLEADNVYKAWFAYNGKADSKQFNAQILLLEGLRGRGYFLSKIKPILRPLSDLNADFVHNGKHILPKIRLLDPVSKEYQSLFDPNWVLNHYQQCIEWHFDVFGLIDNGLALDINKLKLPKNGRQ